MVINFEVVHFMSTQPHIGHLIQATLKEQGRTVVWFARQLCCDRTHVYKIFSKESIDTGLLYKISTILGVDFFSSISVRFKADAMQRME